MPLKRITTWRKITAATEWLSVFVAIAAVNALALFVMTKVGKSAGENAPAIKSQTVAVANFGTVGITAAGSSATTLSLPTNSDGTYNTSYVFESQTYTSDFPFNAVAVQWKETAPAGTTVDFDLRTNDGTTLSSYAPLPANEDMDNTATGDRYSDLTFVKHGTAAQLRITLATSDPQKSPSVQNVKVLFLDSTAGPSTTQIASSVKASATAQPTIITRAQWGADENLRTWAPEYQPVKKFILHHTAGTNGEPDPAASLRGIYYYHTVTRGWGDIGYNFVVDQRGNIYEGRYGGLDVVGAHASSYNYGSMGISMMGNFDNPGEVPSTPALTAVEKLIGWRAAQLNIDPLGSSFFVDKNMLNVVAHRDVGSTACNGANYYALMDQVRTAAAQYATPDPANVQYKAQITSITPQTIQMDKNKRVQVTVKVKNIGTMPWSNSGTNYLAIDTTQPGGAVSPFKDSTWTSEFPYRVTRLVESTVAPGATGTFTFWLNSGTNAYAHYDQEFHIVAEKIIVLENSSFNESIDVIPDWKGQVVSIAPAAVGDSNLVMAKGDRVPVTVKIKNLGSKTWSNSGTNYISLDTTTSTPPTSSFKDITWTEQPYRTARLTEASVPTGGTGTFTFYLAPTQNGTFTEEFHANAEKITVIGGSSFNLTIDVKPAYAVQIDSVTPQTFSMDEGARTQVTVKATNTGARTWTNTGTNYIALDTTQPAGTVSAFKDTTWTEQPYRAARLSEASIAPGAQGTFVFWVAASRGGTFTEEFHPVAEKITTFGTFNLNITVKPSWDARIDSVTPQNITMDNGERLQVTVKATNTGARAWSNSGANYMALDTQQPAGVTSPFKDATWTEFPYRATRLLEPTVAPGAQGTFVYYIKASQYGTFVQEFHPVVEKLAVLSADGFNLNITVARAYDAQITDRSAASLSMTAGQRTEFWIKMKNVGTKTWSNSASDFVALNLTPSGRTSAFQDSSWNEYYYRPTRLEEASVAPGAIGTFHFYLTAPNTGGTYNETFQAVAEHVAWINGSSFTLPITVTAPSTNMGSYIRVGIFGKLGEIRVRAHGGSANILKPGGEVIATIGDNAEASAFDGGAEYYLSGPGFSYTLPRSSVASLTFQPLGSAYLEISSYEDRPGWNLSLNDNIFRGYIVLQHSNADGNFYAINKLPLELYLRGISEQSNTTYYEHLKTMAVAERTYAQYNLIRGGKHPDQNYDVDNKYDQVYKGYGFELRSPNVALAVDETRGQMVTAGGQVALTAYFSQSDGRTRSYSEVWNGYYSYLVSVPDPWCNGLPLLGHGVGLSALGALRQAQNDHKNYQDILKYYYTGAAVTDFY